MKNLTPYLLRICLLLTLAGLGGCNVHHHFHYPTQEQYASPADKGLPFEDIYFESQDGTRLHGWFIPAKRSAKGTLIYFHGNTRNISGHLHHVDWLPEQGFNLFLFDYRGYGKSAGIPDSEGLTQDGVAAIRFIQTRNDIRPNRLLSFGQSLGGTYSLTALSRERKGLCGIVLEGTFFSHREIAIDHMASDSVPRSLKSLASRILIGNQHDAATRIGEFSDLPLLIIHASADDVVPISHGDRLAALAPQSAQYWRIEGGEHLGAFLPEQQQQRARLVQFLDKALNDCEQAR